MYRSDRLKAERRRRDEAYLQAWKDGCVDLLVQVIHDVVALLVLLAHALAVEDHGTPGASQRLVCGCGDHICILKGRWHNSCRNSDQAPVTV